MTLIENKNLGLSSKKQETLNILIYSDIFHYPLTKKEIYERGKISLSDLDNCLEELLYEKKIYLQGEFYSLQMTNEIIAKRYKRNNLARKTMPKARIMAKIIANFPFIRGVFLSGSISKNCMDENSDIDFFIVTEPGRLWVAHLFCTAFKKIFLFNSSKLFCYNFFIDSEHLLINDKSIYTAIEICTLVPLYGYEYYVKIIKMNAWVKEYYPNLPLYQNNDVIKKQTCVQNKLEVIFKNSFGEWLDKKFLAFSIKRRTKRLAPEIFQNHKYYTNLQRHIAKSHITDTYPNIIKAYSQRIADLNDNKVGL